MGTYAVKGGDTLGKIARENNMTPNEIRMANLLIATGNRPGNSESCHWELTRVQAFPGFNQPRARGVTDIGFLKASGNGRCATRCPFARLRGGRVCRAAGGERHWFEKAANDQEALAGGDC